MAYGGLNSKMDAAAEIGRNPAVSKHQIQPEYGDDEQADAGKDDCRTRFARPANSQARTTRTRKYPVSLFCC